MQQQANEEVSPLSMTNPSSDESDPKARAGSGHDAEPVSPFPDFLDRDVLGFAVAFTGSPKYS